MLETIREYAAERLEESGEADGLCARHADWYLALVERAYPEIHRAQGPQWLDRLEAEHANLRLAVDCVLEQGDAERALRLTGAVWLYWLTRGHWAEGRRSLEAALSLASEKELAHTDDVSGVRLSWRNGREMLRRRLHTRPTCSIFLAPTAAGVARRSHWSSSRSLQVSRATSTVRDTSSRSR